MDDTVLVTCLVCWQEIRVVSQTSRVQFDELLVDYGWQPVRNADPGPHAFCPQHRHHAPSGTDS